MVQAGGCKPLCCSPRPLGSRPPLLWRSSPGPRAGQQHACQRPPGRLRRCRAAVIACNHSGNGNGAAEPVIQLGKAQFHDANFPVDDEGRTYHLGTKRGEVAQRVLSVGSAKRAELLGRQLGGLGPAGAPPLRLESNRGFLTITGLYEGVPISIVSTMMGMPNMDFVVRECRAVVEGPMAVVRLGTCGALRPPARLGSVVLASHGSVCIRRNPDAFDAGPSGNGKVEAYQVTRPAPAHPGLSALLRACLCQQLGKDNVHEGLNASADSFYSSQGRTGTMFDDRNADLLARLAAAQPAALSLEMETFHLLDLARCAPPGSLAASAAAIVLAERYSNAFIEAGRVAELEVAAGRACLQALAAWPLEPAGCLAAAQQEAAAAGAA